MDAFEALVATILERQGYWVRKSFKVELSKEEKCMIGLPSAPRWEIDLIAHKGKSNELLVVECKSYLYSHGVRFKAFSDPNSPGHGFKLFNNPKLKEVVFDRLATQLVECGACRKRPKIKLCLVAGHIASDSDRDKIRKHFKRNNWILWDKSWLVEQLAEFPKAGYQNDVASVVAKLVLHTAHT